MKSTLPPLWLDYQRPPPGRQLPGRLLLAVSLALLISLLGLSHNISGHLADSEQHLSRLKQAAAQQRQLAGTALQDQAPSADSRWEALLAALEAASDGAVTLLSLAPGLKEIVITGEARDLGAALDYARRLHNTPAIAQAYIAKHEVLREHPQHPVRFTLLAVWREGGK